MENNLENKAKFFALYLGQKVMRCKTFNTTTGNGLSGLMNVDVNSKTIKKNWFLELKPLSSISDEDARKLAVFCGYHDGNNIVGYRILSGLSLLGYFPSGLPIATALKGHYEAIDYLRLKGYALPWMGLSVEEQVNRAWVKLKGENK